MRVLVTVGERAVVVQQEFCLATKMKLLNCGISGELAMEPSECRALAAALVVAAETHERAERARQGAF